MEIERDETREREREGRKGGDGIERWECFTSYPHQLTLSVNLSFIMMTDSRTVKSGIVAWSITHTHS